MIINVTGELHFYENSQWLVKKLFLGFGHLIIIYMKTATNR